MFATKSKRRRPGSPAAARVTDFTANTKGGKENSEPPAGAYPHGPFERSGELSAGRLPIPDQGPDWGALPPVR